MVFSVLVNLQASVLLIMFIFALTPTLLVSATTPSQYNFTIAKPGCIHHCGNISIPYPFGTTPECYLDFPFLVTCNKTHFNPPKLFRLNRTTEIADISLDGQVKILESVGIQCYGRNGSIIYKYEPSRNLVRYFTVNNAANKFTMVGCNAEAVVSGLRHNRRGFMTGCTAMCEAEDDLMEGSCAGLGCCQTSIPKDVQSVEVELKNSSSDNSDVWNFNSCSYAFVVEESSFTFSPEYLIKLKNVANVPMVLDWAIGNARCKDAKKNISAYTCESLNSSCYDPENGYGYRCRCDQGYEGNPYLKDGCRDIDECANSTLNNCTKPEYCENTNGSYNCSCPKGYLGSGRLPGGCTKKLLDMKIVLIGIAFGIIALLLAAILYMELRTRRLQRMREKFFLQNGGMQIQEKLPGRAGSPDIPRRFSSSELQKATNDFDNSMIIGQGGFGTVYKGFLPDSRTVAIKKSRKVNRNQIEQFINEMSVLSQLNHRNVVRFLGCCLETEVPLLVYEFISNGTLSAHIQERARARFFKWDLRLKIAAEIASVLSYLHSEASTPIIHGDVKSNNVLLDHTFTAKVSDFGASKLVPLDITQLPTMVQGTLGYLDPEYMQTNKLTEKSDVYSFGVILLELLTGRKAMSSDQPEEGQSLASFFLLNQDHLLEILDKNIATDENMEQISEVAMLAKCCLNVKGEDRPSMKVVETKLQVLIQGREHPLARSEDNAEVMDQSLLGKGAEVNVFVSGEGTSATIEYDRLGYDSLTSNGGR